MLECLKNIPTGLFIFFSSFVAALVTIYIHRKNTFNAAANKFKSNILKELEGLVPTNGYWGKKEYRRFRESIPLIKREALEFRSVIPFYRLKGFDKAVNDYCEFSQNMDWITAAADVFYYSEDTEITQKEQYTKNIHILLSYAKG